MLSLSQRSRSFVFTLRVLVYRSSLSLLQTVSANLSGELRLALETDEVTATTYFKGLQNNHFQDISMVAAGARDRDVLHSQDGSVSTGGTRGQDVLTLHEARVDVRKLAQFLQGQFNPTKAICSESRHTLCLMIL